MKGLLLSNNISMTSYGNYETYANEKDMLEALRTRDKSKMISSESTSADPGILACESVMLESLRTGDKSRMISSGDTSSGPKTLSYGAQKNIAARLVLFRQHQAAELLGISVEELKELEKNMWKHNVE